MHFGIYLPPITAETWAVRLWNIKAFPGGALIIHVQFTCFVGNETVSKIIWPSLPLSEKAKSSFLNLQGTECTHTQRANTLVPSPSGQTLLATELIIHNRCSEMFSRIYDGAQRNSQVSLWCCFSLPSYKDKGLHRERMSAQQFFSPPRRRHNQKKFPPFSEIHHPRRLRLNTSQSLGTLGRSLLIYPNNTV